MLEIQKENGYIWSLVNRLEDHLQVSFIIYFKQRKYKNNFKELYKSWGGADNTIIAKYKEQSMYSSNNIMSVHKKYQPNRSSRLAGYTQHKYIRILVLSYRFVK